MAFDDETLTQLLQVVTDIGRGRIPAYQHNASFTVGAFDLLLVNVHNEEAYDLLARVCERYQEVPKDVLPAWFDLLEQLARLSNTTELPGNLRSIMAAHPELSEKLLEWYRIRLP